jgi:hypothetical protein
LQTPEFVRIGEIAFLAEQIGGNRALILDFVKECGLAADLSAAEQPLCRPRNYAEQALSVRSCPTVVGRRGQHNLILPQPEEDVCPACHCSVTSRSKRPRRFR